jgi:hypothetical protein
MDRALRIGCTVLEEVEVHQVVGIAEKGFGAIVSPLNDMKRDFGQHWAWSARHDRYLSSWTGPYSNQERRDLGRSASSETGVCPRFYRNGGLTPVSDGSGLMRGELTGAQTSIHSVACSRAHQ